MRRGILILAAGALGAILAYCCSYLMGTATPRAWMHSAQPELAWLKHEFNLDDAEFRRVAELHAGYLPQCRERCRRIDQLNDLLVEALATSTQLTPEVERLLGERAQMRASCQAEMLRHFFEVSQTMPLVQGRRYLTWVWENTCLHEQAMSHSPASHAEEATPARQP